MNDSNPTVEDTIKFIQLAHHGQKDHGGVDYWNHPVEVMHRVNSPTHEEKLAALLHDVLEDTDYTEKDLLDHGFTKSVVEMVSWLNFKHARYHGMTYIEKIRHLKDQGPPSSVKVKLADNSHNSDPSRAFGDTEKHQGMMRRYQRARDILVQ